MSDNTLPILIDGGIEPNPIFMMLPSDKVLYLRLLIQSDIGIGSNRLTLYSGDRKLRDSDTIGSALRGVSFIRLVVQPLPQDFNVSISVSYPLLRYEEKFQVKETDTVVQLKRRIIASHKFKSKRLDREVELVPRDLFLSRKGVSLIVDDYPLSKYCIHDGCEIDMDMLMIRELA